MLQRGIPLGWKGYRACRKPPPDGSPSRAAKRPPRIPWAGLIRPMAVTRRFQITRPQGADAVIACWQQNRRDFHAFPGLFIAISGEFQKLAACYQDSVDTS
jgi:hypothetical protein